MESMISDVQKRIRVGTHGEDYGSWMSNPVFYVFGGLALAALSFTVFRITALGVGIRRPAGAAELDGLDPPAVRLRQGRHDGAGAPDHSQQPGF